MTAWTDSSNAVAIQADGKIIAGGYVTRVGNQGAAETVIALERYGPNGLLDETFGRHGVVTTAIDGIDGESVQDLVIQPDGRIIASGNVIIRYLP